MVRRGEYLERMVVVPSGELHLEGLYHRGKLDPPCVVAAPHPQQGGSMDSPVVAEIAWAITRAGHATLRFNYRGVGASEGSWGGGVGEVDDLAAAVDQLAATTGAKRVAVAGYSFGVRMAVELAERRGDVGPLVLVAPPVLELPRLSALQARVLVIVPESEAGGLDRSLTSERLRIEVVPEADHYFARGLPQVGRLAAAWVDAG